MKFNLINPSDAYTFEAEDMEVAAVMVCLLGDGKYGADEIGKGASNGNHVPVFLFGGHDEWFVRKFGMNFEDTGRHCLDHRRGALADAFASVTLTNPPRSSMNDIGGRAHALAKGLRAQATAAPGA